MRVFAYFRMDPKFNDNINDGYDFFVECGFDILRSRFICEEVAINTPIYFRNKIFNLVNYSLEEDNVLIVKGVDSLGANFKEIFEFLNIIYLKKIILICLDYSKNEIKGELKSNFLNCIKMSANFEGELKRNSIDTQIVRKVGRPEILNYKQKKEVFEKFNKGCSIYALAKEYSVTRTVIQRLLNKKSEFFQIPQDS